jgi:adenosine deaminase
MTISSDDPFLMGTTLTGELLHAVRLAHLSRNELAELQRRAARNAFLPEHERAALEARVDAWAADLQPSQPS